MAKRKEKIEEKIIPNDEDIMEDEEETQALLEQIDSEELPDEIEEEEFLEITEVESLGWKRIFTLTASGVLSFFLFFVIFFPFGETIRGTLYDFATRNGIILDLKEIDFPIFGEKTIENLKLEWNSNQFACEEIQLNISLFQFLDNKLETDLHVKFAKWEGLETSWQMKRIDSEVLLEGIEDRPSLWAGSFQFSGDGGKINETPEFPIIGNLNGKEIKKFILAGKWKSGRIQIERATIDTNFAKFQITGSLRVVDNLMSSILDLNLCATITEVFANERPDIAGYTALLPNDNGKVCIPLRGSLGNPKLELPSGP